MTTSFNAFGETVIKWSNNIHPDNPNFQQVVNWTIWVKKDGSVLVGYNLGSGGKTKFMYNLTKDEAIAKFS